MKNVMGNLIGVTINLPIALGGAVILTVIILPIQEDGVSFHFFESYSVFTVEYVIGCGFVINSIDYVERCSLYIHFGKSFYHERMLNFIKCLLYFYWDDHVFFSLIGMMYYIDWFEDVKPSLWPWDETSLIMVWYGDLSHVSLDLVC